MLATGMYECSLYRTRASHQITGIGGGHYRMAKVNINVNATVKGSKTVISFKNTRELLNYLARTGGIVTPEKGIVVK